MAERRKALVADKILLLTALTLALFGILMQYSASSYIALNQTGDAFYYVKKQAVALVVALVAAFAASRIKFEILKKFSLALLVVSAVLLALVFVPGLGVEKYGATRWLNLGFTTFQPSELAKFALMIFIASNLSERSSARFRDMIGILLATLAICALVMLEPNMSITVCIGICVLLMLYIGGCGLKQFAGMAIPVVVAIPLLILAEPYRLKRLLAFIDPWASPLGEGYQLIQSYYALGSGGWFGLGLFNSRQKYMFLPFAESDFIFAVIGEELGLIGCIFVIALFCVLIWRAVVIASKAVNRFQTYVAAGVGIVIAVQTLLNIAVVSGSIPPTGLPMPFISSGGSSLVVFAAAVGLLEGIARNSQIRRSFHKMY